MYFTKRYYNLILFTTLVYSVWLCYPKRWACELYDIRPTLHSSFDTSDLPARGFSAASSCRSVTQLS